jgi:hypothetical protein
MVLVCCLVNHNRQKKESRMYDMVLVNRKKRESRLYGMVLVCCVSESQSEKRGGSLYVEQLHKVTLTHALRTRQSRHYSFFVFLQ